MIFAGQFIGYSTYQLESEDRIEQNVNPMGDGTLRVHTKGPSVRFLRVVLPRMTNTQWTLLRAVVTTVKFSETPFAVVMDDSSTYTVRWWDSKLKGVRRLGSFWSAEILLRVEV